MSRWEDDQYTARLESQLAQANARIDKFRSELGWILVCAEDMFNEGDKGYQIAIFAREALKDSGGSDDEG
jgi:hypothetical protein